MMRFNGNNVVFVEGEITDPEAMTSEGIYINKPYRLIYTNELAPEKFALKELSGIEVVQGMNIINSIVQDLDSFRKFKSSVLIPVVENWGRKVIGLPYSKDIPRKLKRIINSASKEHKEDMKYVDACLSAYIASQINSFDEQRHTVVIHDQQFKENDAKKMYECGDEAFRQAVPYEQFLNDFTGMFVLQYPKNEDIEKYLPH